MSVIPGLVQMRHRLLLGLSKYDDALARYSG